MIKIYILLAIVALYVSFVIYCKIRFRFWSTQPVFHLHNLFYWLFPPGIIQHELPPFTKFYDPKIEFYSWNTLSDDKKEQFYRLNRQFYLHDEQVTYQPTRESIFSYFEKHNDPCFISLLYENDFLIHYSKNEVIPEQKCIASLTSRPLDISLHGNKLKVNYVDYLCVDKKKRKQGIAPRMIYSYYVQSRRHHDTMVYLFKREGVGTFITPMTVYLTYGFQIKTPTLQKTRDILMITEDNFATFYHYLKTIKKDFPCFVHPTFSQLKYLLQQKLLYIFLLMDSNGPWGCFVFRNPYTSYNKKGKSIDCIASYCSNMERKDEFILLFNYCFPYIDYSFQYLLIENISHNQYITENILKTKNPFLRSHTSYYLYNFAYRPFLSQDVFLLS